MKPRYNIKLVGNDFKWEEIPVINIDCRYEPVQESITANAQIACGNDRLFVHLWTKEPETRAVETGQVGIACEDSCLEFFFCPMEDDKRYINLEFNSNGCLFMGLGSDIVDLVRILPCEPDETLIDPVINKNDNGWEIFYEVPFELIRRFFPEFKVYEGMEIKANCYKCSDLGNYPHYMSWSKVEERRAKFHQQAYFGTMKFVN